MKKILKVLGLMILLLILAGVYVWAGEREELQLKARAFIAEANLAQSNAVLWQMKLNDAQKAIQEFVKELDDKGFMATQDGTIIEKPKPVEPKKEEVTPAQPQSKPKK